MPRDRSPYRVANLKYNFKPRSQPASEGWYLQEYDAIKAGTIDGLGSFANDRATLKANRTIYSPPKSGGKITGVPLSTIFVGRLSPETTEETIEDAFKEYGKIVRVTLARNFVTGHSRGYSFVEFAQEKDCTSAYENSGKLMIDGQLVIVDYERSRVMIGWKPRRLGGGFSGHKESGQLRFGAKTRPFKITRNVKDSHIPIEQYTAECWRNHLISPKTKINPRHPPTYRDRHYIAYEKRRGDAFDKTPRDGNSPYHKPENLQARKDYYINTRDRKSNSRTTNDDFASKRYNHKTRHESKSHDRDYDGYHDKSRDKRKSSYHNSDQRKASDLSYRFSRDTERRRFKDQDSSRYRS